MKKVHDREGEEGAGGTRMCNVSLPASPASSRLARELLRRLTGRVEDPRAALVVSELITNAVRHADAAPELELAWDGSVVRIAVFDTGTGRPVLRDFDVHATSGRGVAIVDAVADRWGVEERDCGKVVWAEIELGPEASSA